MMPANFRLVNVISDLRRFRAAEGVRRVYALMPQCLKLLTVSLLFPPKAI